LDSLISAISEKEFIIDYHQFYPVDADLQIITKLYPEMYPFLKSLQYYIIIQKHNTVLNLSFLYISNNQ